MPPPQSLAVGSAPWWSCEGWVTARAGWLYKHFKVKFDELICCSCKWAVAGDVLIDDKPKNVELWAERHPEGHAALFDALDGRTA